MSVESVFRLSPLIRFFDQNFSFSAAEAFGPACMVLIATFGGLGKTESAQEDPLPENLTVLS